MDQCHTGSEFLQPLPCPTNGRFVPVDADQSSAFQPGKNSSGMAAQSKGPVQIDSIRVDIQLFDAFLQQDRDMLRHQNSSSSRTAAMFSGVVSVSKTVRQLSLSQSSA